MTGLSDEMKADFNVMREIAKVTRLEPKDRRARIMKLNDDIYT